MRLLLLLAACDKDPAGPSTPEADVATIRLLPESVTLVTSGSAPATQEFTVEATMEDGEVVDDFPLVSYTLSNDTVGVIDDDGLFVTSTTNGGRSLLTASIAGVEASAEITVIYEETVLEDGVP